VTVGITARQAIKSARLSISHQNQYYLY